MRTLLTLLILVALIPVVRAQAVPPEASAIKYQTVAEALKDLEAKDGNGTVVTHSDGWTIINEPLASAQWSFTPSGHYAFPAAVRRVIKREPNGSVAVETSSLCEASQSECTKLLAEFAALNERITQAAKARGRQSSSTLGQ